MHFNLSDEQKLIRNAVDKFIRNDYSFDARKKVLALENGFSPEHWRQFADMGWLGIPFAEDHGGLGGGIVDITLVMESFGTGMVLEPYLSAVVLAGGLVELGGSQAQKEALLPALIGGEKLLAVAYTERESRFNPADVQTRAEKKGNGYVLNGEKAVVLGAPSADVLIVSARTSGNRLDPQGISLFLVDGTAKGVSIKGMRTMDGGQAGNVTLNNVEVGSDALIGAEGAGFALLDEAVDRATVAACADAVGAMQAAMRKTVEYLKTRKQFDVPIGSFQALQHRAVDLFTAVEACRSMLLMASLKVTDPDPVERNKAVSAAKQFIGEKARLVAQQAVQMHGGIGMTEELDIGHYFRRLTQFCAMFGTTDYHLKRYADLMAAAA